METKEYKLLDGRTIRAKYNRLGRCNISKENLEEFVKEFNASYRQAKILEKIKENYALMKLEERKKGKWIKEYDKLDGHFRTYHCSNCENLQGYTSNFCEECGSENREVEERVNGRIY